MPVPEPEQKPMIYRFGTFEADLRSGELRKQGVRTKLHPKAFSFLVALLERPGEVVARAELRQRLWPETFVDFDHALNNAVNSVRLVLGDSASSPRFIETMPRRGYRFIAEVTAEYPKTSMGLAARSAAERAPIFSGRKAVAGVAAALALWPLGIGINTLTHSTEQSEQVLGVPSAAEGAYLKGKHFLDRIDQRSQQRAHEYLTQAVTLAPDYPAALAALALSYDRQAAFGLAATDDSYRKAIATAERSLQLERDQPLAHVALATAKLRLHWDWKGTEQELQAAIELDPKLALAHANYASVLVARGRNDEAMEHVRIARHLAEGDVGLQSDLGMVLYYARHYDEAAAQLMMAVEMDPDYSPARKYLSDVYLQQGRQEAAAEQFRTWLELVGVDKQECIEAAAAIAQSGLSGLARRNLARNNLGVTHYGVPMKLAGLYAATQNQQEAVRFINAAYEQRDSRLLFLAVDPQFDSLRNDARFQEILRRAGL